MAKVERLTPDLSEYPDLVVIYLGMQVRAWYGIKTLLGFGPKISNAVGEHPTASCCTRTSCGRSSHPRGDAPVLARLRLAGAWARSAPHRDWWRGFVRDSGGTGFWHETYLARGGMEAVFDDIAKPLGMAKFAPMRPRARGRCSRRGSAPGCPRGPAFPAPP